MNTYMSAQILNMLTILKTFEQSCEMASLKDDGHKSREEEKQLKKIRAACQKFSKELEAIK